MEREELRLLILEDVATDAELLERELRTKGMAFRSKRVVSREDFIAHLDGFKPHVILADYRLPEFDGMAALAIAREKCPEVPFIVVTGSLGDEVAVEVLKKGATDYILKDRLVRLVPAIERALEEADERAKRKEAEGERQKLLCLVEQSADIIVIATLEGEITYLNSAAGRVCGIEPGKGNKKITLFDLVRDEDLKRFKKEILPSVLRNGQWRSEFCLRHAQQGMTLPVDLMAFLIEAPDIKKPIALAAIIRDITERKAAEQKALQDHKNLRRTFEKAISALAAAVEKRDEYTSGHQRRVVCLAEAIAREMGLAEEQIDGIRLAGVIHDLGKIAVPVEILIKPGRLTKTEFNLIKMHSQVGYEILQDIAFPWPVADIIRQHHERNDGSGYPQGLTGEHILQGAKILAVADVVEAIASHRPYRPALGIEKALEEISQNKGVLYDPAAVDACMELFQEKRFTFNP